ncbi:hypothetical protein GW17_00000924 [Ensete ventricosum]|nr:hypothetical protein GW17_00000924 [Ensete ventricosum]
MAEHDAESNGELEGHEEATHDLQSLLANVGRDFLVRNTGDQVPFPSLPFSFLLLPALPSREFSDSVALVVLLLSVVSVKISHLDGKIVGLYFSASWCGPCQRFTPKLIETYNELSSKNGNFEIVFVSADEDEESFTHYFSKMPWFAIPFSDSDIRDRLNELFDVGGIPYLVIFDVNGKVLTSEGVQVVRDYGSNGYPFTDERIEKLKEEEEAAKQNQTLRSLLVTSSRDFVISKDGNKVPVSELEGKIVGIYFSVSSFSSCSEFAKSLAEMYLKLKENGENFEVVLVSLDDEESSYEQVFADMPWLAIPYKDKICDKLVRYFELASIPTLVIIGSDGKTLNSNVAELIEEHGIEAYPFSPEKLEEIAEKEKAKRGAQTLESLLASGERDYVIGKGDITVPVAELVGKNILLYFSAHWCPPCRMFLPKLIEAYHKIKEKDDAFEIIFVSSDHDESSFHEFFSEMPWLALPFGDERKKFLSRTFKIYGIPSLVAIGPTGKTVTTEARELVRTHGVAAYPFTEEHIQELEAEIEEMAKDWPEKLKHKLHEQHELVKSRRRGYICDACNEEASGWSFYCDDCDFDLHPKCALNDDKEANGVGDSHSDGPREEQRENGKEGYICDGEVCYKA